MLDLAFVRANLPLVEEKLRARGVDPEPLLGDFDGLDKICREAITAREQAKARLNRLSDQVGALKKSGQDVTGLMDEIGAIERIFEEQTTLALVYGAQMRQRLEMVPNLTQDWIESPNPDIPSKARGVPPGRSEENNITVKTWRPGIMEEDSLSKSAWRETPDLGFEAKPHWELGRELGILDLELAAKISGARFAVYMGAGARLERALISFMLDMHTQKHGYKEVLPPFMVNEKSLFGTGQMPKFAADLFRCADLDIDEQRDAEEALQHAEQKYGDGSPEYKEAEGRVKKSRVKAIFNDHWLIPTAEVPVTNLYRDEILDGARLPISLTAYTPCFRAEAGAAGKDTRGIIRQHQFQKVELVKFTRPEESDAQHEKLTRDAEEILEALNLPYRRVLLCTGDTGFSSAKTYDLEVWLPGQGLYREISSCSNFEAFQARRANIRFRPAAQGAKGKPEFVHTLNGSGLAVGRTWVAIVENYQQPDGTISIPEVLRPYMGGINTISKEL